MATIECKTGRQTVRVAGDWHATRNEERWMIGRNGWIDAKYLDILRRGASYSPVSNSQRVPLTVGPLVLSRRVHWRHQRKKTGDFAYKVYLVVRIPRQGIPTRGQKRVKPLHQRWRLKNPYHRRVSYLTQVMLKTGRQGCRDLGRWKCER